MKVVCFHCKNEIPLISKVGFRDECDKCRYDLHVCKNCEFYDPKVYNECRETSADVVKEKERANFCDYFSPNQSGSVENDRAAKLKAAAEALFKKS
jgi:hypothetical protein